MKKVLFLCFAFAGVLFANDGDSMVKAYALMASGLGLGIAAFGGAIGIGNAAAATISGIARNPSIGSKLTTTMFITIALIEAQVIYTLVIVLIMLYANPFLG